MRLHQSGAGKCGSQVYAVTRYNWSSYYTMAATKASTLSALVVLLPSGAYASRVLQP